MLLVCALIGVAAPAAAVPLPIPGGSATGRPATIEATGQAKVSQIPDRVYIDLGVTTQAQKSQDAAAQNASRLSAVIAAVRRAAGSGAQLATTGYSISPNYNYPRNGGTPTVVGYTVSNVVELRLDDLKRIGPVIDAATRAGSNDVQDIRFALRDEEAPRAEALREAALNARQDADALAGALGLRVVRVLSVSEQGPSAIPVYPRIREFARVEAAPATPVEAGTIDVNATVSLTVEVAPVKR